MREKCKQTTFVVLFFILVAFVNLHFISHFNSIQNEPKSSNVEKKEHFIENQEQNQKTTLNFNIDLNEIEQNQIGEVFQSKNFRKNRADFDIKKYLDRCQKSDINLSTLINQSVYANYCTKQKPLKDFVCICNCSVDEPELELKMKFYGMQNYSIAMVKEYCVQKQVSALIWINKNEPKFYACDERVKGQKIWSAFQHIFSFLACAVELPDVLFAFDNGDYAVPKGKKNWIRPLPGIVRYAGLPSHPSFLFPIREYLTATTHAGLGIPTQKTTKIVKEIDLVDTCKPFEERKNVIHWRGSLTGNYIHSKYMGFNPRLRLVENFAKWPLNNDPTNISFDVGLILTKSFKKARTKEIEQTFEFAAKSGLAPRFYCENKYLLHVEGNSFAGSLAFRLSTGSLVLKVDSVFGFYEFFYDRLLPWRHYIPIDSDLGNLLEIKQFLETNNGQELAKQIIENVKHEVFDKETGFLRGEANYCYMTRLIYSLASTQAETPTKETLESNGIKAPHFLSFPVYRNNHKMT